MTKRVRRNSVLLGVIIGLLLLVFMTALAVGLLLSNNLLYRLDMALLDIPETSGLPEEVILRNYNAVKNYLSPFSNDDFVMPDLPASVEGVNHFGDAKAVINALYIAGGVSLVLIVLLMLVFRKRMGVKTLRSAAVTSFLVPLAAGTAALADFDSFFVIFHEIFFRNDDWLFDPFTDPVINILPIEYFLHCAITIAIMWLLGSLFFFILSVRRKRREQNRAEFVPRY